MKGPPVFRGSFLLYLYPVQHLILLHGAIGHKKQLQPLAALLEEHYTVHNLNFSGHGGEAPPENDFSIELFAGEVLQYMNDNNITAASFFGYSMGGYVAMYLSCHFPDRVAKVITLATKYYWDVEVAAKECKMLDANKIEEKLPSFAQYLQQGHAPNDWKTVLSQTRDMLTKMGADNPLKQDDYPLIEIPVLLLLGDRDKMVTLDETINVYRSLPQARMGMLPNTAHPIEQVNPNMLSFHINSFLKRL